MTDSRHHARLRSEVGRPGDNSLDPFPALSELQEGSAYAPSQYLRPPTGSRDPFYLLASDGSSELVYLTMSPRGVVVEPASSVRFVLLEAAMLWTC